MKVIPHIVKGMILVLSWITILLWDQTACSQTFEQVSAKIESDPPIRTGAFDTLKCRLLLLKSETAPEREWESYNKLLRKISHANIVSPATHPALVKTFRRYYSLALNNEGVGYQNHSGHGKEALKYFVSALRIALLIKDTFCVATSLHNMGGYYTGLGEDDKATAHYALALRLRRLINDKNGMASTLNGLGYILQDKGDFSRTVEYYYKGLKLYEETNNLSGEALTLNNVGSVYNSLGDTLRALECFRKSLDIYKRLNDKGGVLFPLHNIGHIYLQANNTPEALKYYYMSLDLARSSDNRKGVAHSSQYLAEIYLNQEEFEHAKENYKRAYEIYQAIADKRGMAATCYGLARTYLALKEPEKAAEFARIFYSISSESDYKEYRYRGALLLSEIYANKAQFKEAFKMKELANGLIDTLNLEKVRKENIKKQFEYEYESRERELRLKQAVDGKIQLALYSQKQGYTISGFILLMTMIAIWFGFLYYRSRLKRERMERHLQLQIKDSEIRALQAQMNPHFIFNSLNSVLEFVRKSEREEALKYLSKFSRLIRMTLESSENKSITLSSELELLTLYIDLENLRFGNNFIYSLVIDDSLDVENTEIPTLVIQPFVENAILHGLQNKYLISQEKNEAYEPKLFISIRREGSFLKCLVQDNGIGRQRAAEIISNKLFSHHSMGMRITTERLSLLGQNKCKLEIYDLKDPINKNGIGTRVEILIPIVNEAKSQT